MSCDGRGTLLHGVPTYPQLERAIAEVSGNSVQAHKPSASTKALHTLFARHPLISLNELAAAFDLADEHAAMPLVQPRIDAGEIAFAPAPKGRFLSKKDAPRSEGRRPERRTQK